jgi:glycosyltransferase involved in cell wall biosynthesis
MDKDIITILDPELIAQSQDIIQSLAREGLNHLTSDPKLGWNYVLDHVWITKQIEQYITAKKQRSLTILDVGCGRSRFHNFLEKRLGINIIGIDRPQGYCHQAQLENIDYYEDFLQLDAFPENSVDIIYWLSAIEHNEKEKIRQLFQKSMSLLKEGGLFLATFAISEKTHWFQNSEQTNLSVADSMDIFDIYDVQGNLQSVKDKYRRNILLLRDKYERRYRKFGLNDPTFVVGAVHKTKVKVKAIDLPLQTIPQSHPYIYLFVPSNDTHVHWMRPLAKALEKSCFMVISEKNERANFYLDNLGEKFHVYKNGIIRQVKPDVLIFGCDWGGHEQQVIREASALGIPTVCIQEGCLDFMDQRANRMLHADYAFLQGPVMLKYIRKENNVFVTGNPKYDFLYETPLPDKPMVMINSNFTYGIFEDARDQWVSDVAETCKSLGLDFFISQHPRDKGIFPSEYKVVKSDAFKLHQQLQDSSILVSRFSTVIYEAAAMGREVVYYNPHHEPFRIFSYDVTGGIQVVHNPSDLAQAIKSAVYNLGGNNEKRREFILQHCSTLEHDAVKKCSECLQAIAAKDANKLSSLSQDSKYCDNKSPTVSVIIPCYNTAKYLGQAIESVLSQTFGDFEIIVVDDGSTDNTAEITQSFADSRIHYIQHPRNKGLAAARNTGIQHSRGKYICFLDADDYFLPHKLKKQIIFLENYQDYGLVSGGYLRVDKEGNLLKKCEPRVGPIFLEQALAVNPFIVHSTLIRREWIERVGFFDEDLRAGEDWDLHCRLIMLGCLMYRMNSIVCGYRFVPGSLSMDFQHQRDSMLKVIEKTFADGQPKLPEVKAQAKGYTYLRAATYCYASNNIKLGRHNLELALRCNPNFYRYDFELIIRFLLNSMEHLNIDYPTRYFKTLFENLPKEAHGMQKLYRQVICRAMSHRFLNSFKDKHRGQRCVIIANGGSLKEMDLSFLKSEISIGLDQIDIRINHEDFSPDYYICLNPLLIDRRPNKILQMPSTKFLDIEFLNFVEDPADFISLCKKDRLMFTRDAREALGDCPTSVFAALQLAYFMGFDEVILIGNDHNLVGDNIISQQAESPTDVNVIFAVDHFGEDPRNSLTDLQKVTVAYQIAKKNFEDDDRRIVDATLGSKLAIFPKVDYRQIFFSGLYQNNIEQKTAYKQFENIDSNTQNKAEVPGIRKEDNDKSNVIRWGNLWDEPKPDAIRNFFSIANSYKELGLFDTARTLFEKILRRMEDAIDGVDFTSCSEFVNQQEMTECFVSTCTNLSQCYAKLGAWDKVKRIYSGLLNRKNLILPEQQKQDILNVLKKLQNVKIPEKALQIQPTENNSHYKTSAPPVSKTEISRPLVSAIMPAYNAEGYIAAAIESVLSQDYEDFELVIINDGSTDKTEETVYSFKDNRIRYFRQENQGLAATHNTGIRQSRGQFIIKLDADDKMTPDFITRHLQKFEENPEADLVYCDDYLIDKNDKPIRIIKRPEYMDRRLLIRDLFRCGYPIVPFRTCIRRSVFDKIGFFDENLPIGEDYDMMRRFVKHGLKISHLPSALYLRRMTENSLSRDLTPQKAKCQFELVKRFTETFSHDELFPDVKWDKMPADKIQLNAKCLAVVTYLAIGQDYLNAHSAGFYANAAFNHACSELRECLNIDPGNHQIRELLQKCELGRQRYEKHSRQLVC